MPLQVSTVVLFGLAVEREEREEGGYLYNITQVANSLGFRAANAVRRFKQEEDYFMKAPAPHKARPSFWGTWDVLWHCLVGMRVFTKRSRQIYDDISKFVEDNSLLLEASRPADDAASLCNDSSATEFEGSHGTALMGNSRTGMEGGVREEEIGDLPRESFLECFNRADRLEKGGDLITALSCYEQCVEMEPSHTLALNNRGHVLYRMVEFKRALMDYDRALAIDPLLTVARYNRGEVLYRLMRYAEAEKDLEEVLQQRPDFESARRLLDVCREEHAEKKAKSSATASCTEVDQEMAAAADLEPSIELSFADRVAHACLHQYYRLPSKGKPKEREWGVLAGIVMTMPSLHDSSSLELKVVALATGTKCLSVKKMREEGDVVHDSHAEVLAHRLLQHFLEQEIMNAPQSRVLEVATDVSGVPTARYRLREMVSFHLYISQAPCGDASIFPVREMAVSYDTAIGEKRKRAESFPLTDTFTTVATDGEVRSSDSALLSGADPMVTKRPRQLSDGPLAPSTSASLRPRSAREAEENGMGVMASDIHRTGAKVVPSSPLQDPKGEGVAYHVTGVLRTKPGQVESTESLSCSDKIALWSVVGVQGSLLSMLLMKPVYLSSVVVGCLYSEESLRRALITRLSGLHLDQQRYPGYTVTHPNIYHTHYQYSRSKEVLDLRVGDWVRLNPSGSAMVWNCADVHEVIVGNGKLQGVTKKTFSNPKLNSILSNREKFARYARIVSSLPPFAATHLPRVTEGTTFGEVKQYAVEYQGAKAELFAQVSVFSHWIRSSPQWSRFTIDGSVVPFVGSSDITGRAPGDHNQEGLVHDRQRMKHQEVPSAEAGDHVMEIGSNGPLELQELPEFPGLSSR